MQPCSAVRLRQQVCVVLIAIPRAAAIMMHFR